MTDYIVKAGDLTLGQTTSYADALSMVEMHNNMHVSGPRARIIERERRARIDINGEMFTSVEDAAHWVVSHGERISAEQRENRINPDNFYHVEEWELHTEDGPITIEIRWNFPIAICEGREIDCWPYFDEGVWIGISSDDRRVSIEVE